MTVSAHAVTATILGAPNTVVDVLDATVTLDEGWAPYAQVRLRCYTPPEATLALIDPRNPTRVAVVLTRAGELPSTRSLNLGLRSRQPDHVAGTMELVLASDEGILQDYTLLSAAPERTFGLSVRNAVLYALQKIGVFALEPGSSDAALQSKVLEPPVTNLQPNPVFYSDKVGWVAGGSSGTITRIIGSSPILNGSGYILRLTAAATFSVGIFNSGGQVVDAYQTAVYVVGGERYTTSLWVRSSTATSMTLNIEWVNSAGTNVGAFTGLPVALAAGVWTLMTTTATAPATAARAGMYCYRAAGAFNAGDTFDIDAHILHQGSTPVRFFWWGGLGSAEDAGLYSTGVGVNGTSLRTSLPNTDATIWEPGVSAWNFVAPLVQAGGLKLYCDEARRWFLVKKVISIDGVVTVAEKFNAKTSTDIISRNNTTDWYQGVIIRYQWTDLLGVRQTRYDIAGTPNKVLSITIERPYPGPGAASSVLARAAGQGRVFDLTAISDYNAQPGQQLVATLPGALPQVGVVSAVSWRLPADDMAIKSRALVETPLSSWVFATVGRRWVDIPIGTSWSAYTP